MKNKTKPILFLLLGMGVVLSAQEYDGKVGIETNAPQETLHVNGTVRLAEPGDYDPKAVLLGRHKDTKQLVALKPTQSLFSKKTVKQDYTYGGRINVGTGLYAEDVEVAITNARLVEKNTENVPAMAIFSVGSNEYWYRTRFVTGTIPNNTIVAAFLTYYNRNTYVTMSDHYAGTSNYYYYMKKGFFSGEEPTENHQRNILFYSPPKYYVLPSTEAVNVNGKMKHEWRVVGGFLNQIPIDNQVPMEYIVDLLVIDKKIVTNVGVINANVSGTEVTDYTIAPADSDKHPVSK